jgi:hypothetical protein
MAVQPPASDSWVVLARGRRLLRGDVLVIGAVTLGRPGPLPEDDLAPPILFPCRRIVAQYGGTGSDVGRGDR